MSSSNSSNHRVGGLDFVLARGAETYPDRVVIDDRLNGVCLTFAELRKRSMQLARALQRLGVCKGDRVAYAFFNEHASIEALFACAVLGAIAVPLNTRLHPEEASRYVAAQGCKVFMARSDLIALVASTEVEYVVERTTSTSPRPAGDTTLNYEEIIGTESGIPMPPSARWEDPYMYAMTGGTTGGSKAVSWTHGGSMFDILSVIASLGIKRNYSTICLAPTFHAAGLGWAFMPSFWQAGKIIFSSSPSFSPELLHATLAEEDVQFLFLIPAMIGPIYRTWNRIPITCVKSVCVASAPTPETLRRYLSEIFPEADIVTAYGMTESFSVTVQNPEDLLTYPASVGEPALDSRVRILDAKGREVPRGVTGHIVTRTLAMGLGYNNDPESTAMTFKKCGDDPEGLDWIFTGDLGTMDQNGRVEIVDRLKDIIISGGENVPSIEVETVIMSHPAVRECAVVGIPDDQWGELVSAVIVKGEDKLHDHEMASEILELCRAHLSGYKIPKCFYFIDALPRSSFGKVLKRDLRAMEFGRALVTKEIEGRPRAN